MKAIVYEQFQGKLEVKQVKDPEPTKGGVVVKVKATGLCRSDWHGWMGHDPDISLPHVPGHELAGEVVAIGDGVKSFKNGDRVTVPFVCGCGTCRECRSGNHQVCDAQSQPGFTHWGSFAEYVSLDHADINVVKLPDPIDETTAALLGCRFITSFRAVVDQGKLMPGQFLAVHGCGGVGLSAIMIAKAIGASVVAIDINDEALRIADGLGADLTINGKKNHHLMEEIKQFSNGGVHVSIDALGSEQTCYNSIASLRKRGKHIQVGLMTDHHANAKVPMALILANELEVIGSHGMQAHRFPQMLSMIMSGKLQPQKMIQQTISLEEAIQALPAMGQNINSGVLIIDRF